MNGVFFKPWVGKSYLTRGLFQKRILILGESHYQWDEHIPLTENLTIECVEEQLGGTRTHPFWTKIVASFLGRAPSLQDKCQFWHEVAFYNYVQWNVGFGARVRPKREMWAKSEPGFIAVLGALEPECVIVLGYQLWARLPALGNRGPTMEGARQTESWLYPRGNGDKVLAYAILHPSSGGFSGNYWHPFIMRAIEMA